MRLQLGLVVALIPFGVGCATASATPEMIPGTDLAVEELLLPADRDSSFVAAHLSDGAMCFAREVNYRGASNGSLARLGMRSRFRFFYEDLEAIPKACPITIQLKPIANDSGTILYRTERCQIALEARELRVDRIVVQLRDRTVLTFDSCLYRSFLIVEGLSGALTLPDTRLLRPNERSLFRGEKNLMGEWAPEAVFWFHQLCRDSSKLSANLTRQALRNVRICRTNAHG
jgi:hypothetical protein